MRVKATHYPPSGHQQTEEKLCWEALREALDEELERDSSVCVIGEDVGHYGGSYKVRISEQNTSGQRENWKNPNWAFLNPGRR